MNEAREFAGRAASLMRGGLTDFQVIESLRREERAGEADGWGSFKWLHRLLRPRNSPPRSSVAATRIAERVQAGAHPAHAIAAETHPSWRVIAAAWYLAEKTGAAAAEALERIASALEQLQHVKHRRTVLLQGPRSTVVIVCALPTLAFFAGHLMGFQSFQQLTNPAGLVMLILGGVLLLSGMTWSSWLIRRVARLDHVAGLELDLLSIALAGGHAPDRGLLLIADSIDEVRAEWIPFSKLLPGEEAERTLRLAEDTGAPVRPLLIIAAQNSRARARTNLERAAEKLAVRVLIPLGLCILPAFIVAGVLPVVMSMVGPV